MPRYLLASLLLVAACGGDALNDPSATTQDDSTNSTVETTEGAPVETVDSSQPTETSEIAEFTTTTTSDLPVAPDFSLELGTGGEFRLSDTDNPVYLIFWAEW